MKNLTKKILSTLAATALALALLATAEAQTFTYAQVTNNSYALNLAVGWNPSGLPLESNLNEA